MSNPSDTDIAWLAGLLEGEGCFMVRSGDGAGRRPSLAVETKMTDLDIVARVAAMVGGNVVVKPDPRPHHNTCYSTTVAGAKAERVMRLVLPHMGARRAHKIRLCLAFPNLSHTPRNKEAIVD